LRSKSCAGQKRRPLSWNPQVPKALRVVFSTRLMFVEQLRGPFFIQKTFQAAMHGRASRLPQKWAAMRFSRRRCVTGDAAHSIALGLSSPVGKPDVIQSMAAALEGEVRLLYDVSHLGAYWLRLVV
jgi:hypothetical protein